jgi:hypothetical protein
VKVKERHHRQLLLSINLVKNTQDHYHLANATTHFLGLDWSSRSSPIHQRSSPPTAFSSANKSSPIPDTASLVYPDRLIRPLPKRRLRDRLSAQQTDDIVFPSVPSKEAPLFSFPYPEANHNRGSKESGNVNEIDGGRGGNSRAVRRDTGSGSGAERSGMTKSSPRQGTLRQRPQGRNNMGKTMPTPPPSNAPVDSANSSVDGDESFENTNNKKKRKIPQPQHSMSSAGTLLTNVSTDMANLGLSSKEADSSAGAEAMDGESVYHSPGGTVSLSPTSMANSGLPGSGRRPYGRSGRGSLDRRPLTTSTNALNFSGSARSRLSPSSKSKFARCFFIETIISRHIFPFFFSPASVIIVFREGGMAGNNVLPGPMDDGSVKLSGKAPKRLSE